jgi:hypothetical protein
MPFIEGFGVVGDSGLFGGTPAVKWRGPQGAASITRGKAKWDFSAETVKVTVSYTGNSAYLMAARPPIGGVLKEFAPLVITGYTLNEEDGDSGTLSVIMEMVNENVYSPTPIGNPIYELEICELFKPIETNPRCGTLKPDRPVPEGENKKRTWEDWADLTTADYTDEDSPADKAWTLAQYQSLKNAGVDSYPVPAPVIRRTLIYLNTPADIGLGLGTEQNPPAAAPRPSVPFGVPSWKWLLSADNLRKEGRLRTRQTEWTGALVLENLLYGEF